MSMMKSEHYRASALPALFICSKYVGDSAPGEGSAEQLALTNGQLQHQLLASLFEGHEDASVKLGSFDRQCVLNAFRKITAFVGQYAPEATIESEVDIAGLDGRGIADVIAWDGKKKVLVVIDYKSHASLKDYAPQTKWYALHWLKQSRLMKSVKKIYVGVFFGDTSQLQMEELLPQELMADLQAIMATIAEHARQGIAKASPWCAHCAKRGRCRVAADEIKRAKTTYQPSEDLPPSLVAERLNDASEVEKRIRELKSHAKALLEDGVELIDREKRYGFKIQTCTSHGIDFIAAYTYFSRQEDPALLEDFVSRISISKTDIESLLQKAFPPEAMKERSQVLKSLLGEGVTTTRLKRYLI